MREHKLVTVVMPVYNLENYLEKALNSLLVQTYCNLEIVAVDDGSQDNSIDILKSYEQKFEGRLRILRQQNSGPSAARNYGMQEAKGYYLTFLDGDDYLEKRYIERLYNKIEDEKLDCVVCGYTRVDENGNVLYKLVPDISNELYKVQCLACCSKMYRREYLCEKEIVFPEGKFYEDVSFSWNVFYKSSLIGIIDCTGYMYVQRHGSTSMSLIKKGTVPFEEYERIIQRIMWEDSYNKELFEYSVMSFFTYLIFLQGRKSSWNILEEICIFVEFIFDKYFENYINNKYLRNKTYCKRLPFSQRWGIKVFTILLRTKQLKNVVKIMASRNKENDE